MRCGARRRALYTLISLRVHATHPTQEEERAAGVAVDGERNPNLPLLEGAC